MEIGYKLSSEEHGPRDLVRYARMAEDSGFTFALISDHFHPWIDRQGDVLPKLSAMRARRPGAAKAASSTPGRQRRKRAA